MATKKKAAPQRAYSIQDLINEGIAYTPESTEATAAAEPEKRTWGQAVGDTVVQLAEGVNTTLGAVPSIVAPDGATAEFFRDNAEYWRDKQSDVLKQRIAATDQRIQEAGKEGVMSQIGAAASEYWNDPAQAARLVATNLPSMAATLGTGALAGAAAKGVAAARGVGAAGEAALAAQYGTRTAMATNAALNAGGARGEAYEDLKRAALAQGMSAEQAEQVALDGSIMPGVVGGVAGAVSGKLGLEKALLGQPGAGAGTALRRAAGSFGAELAGEQIEEVAPKLTTNYEAGKIDPARSLTDDLGRTMVETAIGAGPGAIVAGGVEGMSTPAQAAADTIRATEKVPESGALTKAVNAGVEAKAQAVEAGAPVPTQPGSEQTAEAAPEAVDDPVRDQILALPDGARQDALRAYAVVNRTDVAKGVQQYNRKLLDRLLTENAPPPVLGERLTETDMGSMLGGGGMAGRSDPLAGALGMNNEAQANSITNVANVAERRPPMPASDAARMLDEARNRGLDLAVAEHPGGGFVLVPPSWVTPDMAAQGEARLKETIARMQQADAAPVERAPRTRTDGVGLNLQADPVQNYLDSLRSVNTPAARAYVRDFDAGRITPADVQRRMQAEQGLTPEQRIARAAAEAPAQVDTVAERLRSAAAQGMATPAPTDILNPAGEPFKTRMAADRAAKKTPGAVVSVEGGFVVRPQEPVNVQDVPQAPEVPQTAPAVSQPAQAQEAVGAQPAGPAAGVPTEGVGAVEAAGVIPEIGRNEPQAQSQQAQAATESVAQPPAPPQSAPATHADPGQAPEAATPAVVTDSLKKAARNEDTKPSEMRKWLVGKIDEAIAVAPEAAVDFLSFDVPGDGTFKVQNSQARLQEFRKKVMASPGFKDSGQRQNTSPPEQTDSARNGSGSTVEAIRNFLADGDVQGAVEFAKLKGVEFTPVEPRASMTANGKFKRVPASVTSKPPSVAEGLTQVEAEQLNQYLTAERAMAETAAAQDADAKPSPQDTQLWSRVPVPAADAGKSAPSAELGNEAGSKSTMESGQSDAASVPPTSDAAQPDTTKLTPTEAKSLMAWEDLGQKDGVKTHALTFYESQADKDAKRGRMIVAKVSKGDRSATAWMVDGEDKTFGALAQAKKLAEEVGMAKAVADGFVEQGATKPTVAAKPAATATAGAPITDFGQKIGGARKDVWSGFKDDLNKVLDDDIAGQPLAKVWPAPDYQKLIDAGMDAKAVAAVRALRDEVPAKPRAAWKVKRWAEQVKTLRGLANDVMGGKITVQDMERMGANKGTSLRGMMGRIELYELVGHAKSLEGVRFAEHHYTLYRGRENVNLWVVEKDAGASAFSNWPREIAIGDTKEQALAAFREKYDSLDLQNAVRKASFDIFSERTSNGFFIGKKIGRNYAKLEGPFATVKEAREYRQNNLPALEAKLEKYKEIPRERSDVNQPRVGVDMRNGQDVTPQMFSEVFGFRGVEFGNWVEQKRRQKDLNDAFDALMDMAAVLGIPAKAISLNGELGLAFGARGSGGVNPAAAHYEPDSVVINLTKKEGAGSLGHEWWHALDNYFAKQRKVNRGSFMTTGTDVGLAARGKDYYYEGGIRQEMIDAFGAVVKAINQTAMKARAAKLDGKRSKEYWTTGEEMSARAFESYLISKLQDQDASNDYLANVVSEKTWDAMAALGMENDGSYPYPTAAEIPAIRAGFDHFFQTVETKEDDAGNVAMFSRTAAGLSPEQAVAMFNGDRTATAGTRSAARRLSDERKSAAERMVAGLKQRWAEAPEIIVARNMQDEKVPQRVRDHDALLKSQGATGEARGFIYGGKVYLLSDQLKGPQQIAEVLFHEVLGHYGLRGAFGDALTPILQQIAALRRADVQAKAKEYGLDMANEKQRLQAAEEVLAEMAQTKPELGYVKRAIAAIRTWLRANVPGFKEMALTDAEIVRSYLLPARGFVERGRIASGAAVGALGPAFSLGAGGTQSGGLAPMSPSPAKTPLYEAFRQLARFGDAFQLRGSNATDLAEIAQDMQEGRDQDATFTAGPSTALHRGTRKKTLALYTKGLDGEQHKLLDIFEADSDRPFVVIGNSEVGQRARGARAYQIAFAWAHNNGKTMRPDPAGLTVINRLRRSEAMISSALRFGTTRHLEPHADQYIALAPTTRRLSAEPEDTHYSGNPQLHGELEAIKEKLWTPGDDAATIASNVQHLIEASAQLARMREPALRDLEVVGGALRNRRLETSIPLGDLAAGGQDATRSIAGITRRSASTGVGHTTAVRYAVTASVARAIPDNGSSPAGRNGQNGGDRRSGDAAAVRAIGQTLGRLDGGAPAGLSGVLYSRTAGAGSIDDGPGTRIGAAIKAVTAANIKKRAGFKWTDYLGIGLQALGRRQIVDIYGDLLPLAEYNRLVQQMEADKNEGGAEADQLVTRWAKLDDEGKLADLMHDATLAQIDPAEDFVEGDDKGKYLELRRKYNLLSDDAKKVYADTRDSYKAHHAKVRSAIKERIERSEIKGERKAALLKQMDDEFFKAIKGVYFPLARFGQYAVTVKGSDGKVESVSRAETKAEAEALRNNLLSAFPRDKGFTVGRVMLSKDFIADRDAVGRGFMTELYQVLDKQDMDAAQRAELEDTLGQLYLSSLPDLSWAKHGIHRKGTPGFSQDARRAFAQNMFHGARYLAKLRYSDLMQDELAAMQRHVDDWREVEDFDQNSAQRVVDEMNKRHESLMNPKSNPLSTALTSLGFVFHLGLSPASAMVNLSQTALVAYPIMGAKWGFGKASAALLKASAEAAKGKNDITASLNADERAAYDEAVRAGTIDVTMAHDLAGIAQGEDAGVMWKIRPVMRWASFLFHHAERFNRQVTFVAAYRLAREAGAEHKAAFEQATKATYDGHFDYGAANRPRIMQGNVAKVLLLFKQYGQNMVYTLARNAQQAIKGESPEVRAQARKALGGLLATHAAAAGVLGLPMVTTLLAAASMIGGDDDEPWDAKVALQNMLADTLGQKPAEVLAHGLSRLTPWDISGRVGLDKLIFPDVQEGLEGQRLGEAAMAAALGPVAGIGINVLKGLQDMSQGQYARGLESMLPAALRGPVKAIRYESEGVQDKTGVVIKDDVSVAGVAGQFLGFSPSEVRNATEGKSAVIQQDRALLERRQELLTKAARATMAKDAEARAEAMKEIERFNQKNPTRRITPLNVLQSVRNRQKRIDQAEGGVYLPKSRRDAMEAGRFAVVD